MSRTDISISAEGIGKLYMLGKAARPSNFREAVGNVFGSTLRRLRGYGEDRSRLEEFWALKDVSFEVRRGEAVGILGRNGAGKSTLMKVLSRITEPTEGTARLRGRVGSLLEVGTGFHPELTGRENIYLNGSILGMKRAEISRRFDEIVAFSEVERFLDTPVKRYSSGMYIRLAFAVAAHLEPEILFVDEVLAVGDIEFQRKCLGKMNEVVDHGRTVFFVSHNMQSIAALTRRCLVMQAGRVILDAPTDQAVKTFVELTLKGSTLGQPFVREQPGDPDENYLSEARVITSEPSGRQVWGEPLAFEFVVHVGTPMSKLCMMFWITDSQGVNITHCWQFDDEQPYQSRPGDYRFRCEIPKCRLYMGTYAVTAWVSDTRGLLPIDAQKQICQFEVDMGEYRRKGFDWLSEYANYLEDFSWQPVAEA